MKGNNECEWLLGDADSSMLAQSVQYWTLVTQYGPPLTEETLALIPPPKSDPNTSFNGLVTISQQQGCHVDVHVKLPVLGKVGQRFVTKGSVEIGLGQVVAVVAKANRSLVRGWSQIQQQQQMSERIAQVRSMLLSYSSLLKRALDALTTMPAAFKPSMTFEPPLPQELRMELYLHEGRPRLSICILSLFEPSTPFFSLTSNSSPQSLRTRLSAPSVASPLFAGLKKKSVSSSSRSSGGDIPKMPVRSAMVRSASHSHLTSDDDTVVMKRAESHSILPKTPTFKQVEMWVRPVRGKLDQVGI
jgi:hypothetical protein